MGSTPTPPQNPPGQGTNPGPLKPTYPDPTKGVPAAEEPAPDDGDGTIS